MNPEASVVRRGTGMPLVAIHGNGVDHRLLLPLDPCFDDGWERLYLDLPGFGGAPALTGHGDLPDLARWLVDAVRGLVGTAPFALLANSLGGLLARHLVAQLGEQVVGIALIAPVVDPDPARRTLPDRLVVERDDALLASLPADDRAEFTGIAARQTAESWLAFRDHALPGIRSADPTAMSRLAARYVLDDVPEAVSPPFVRPALVVTGRQDHVVGYRDQLGLLDHYAAATYATLDRAGHNVHLEQPDVVSALVREWSRRVRGAARGPGVARQR
ncbi:alpha/beta fold hydrolase [Georgenia sp. Z1491]|uniref:alpha/beta fold hydrolase n=1 Tax=Georgenia sp. Z1491 TaxID=3416707 RepID=UPI003CF51AF8